MQDIGLWVFLGAGVGAGAVALFSFLSVAAWSEARKSERIALERLALYRKLADSPLASVELVLSRLREEDGRQEERLRQKAQANKVDSRQTGFILIAAGAGLGFFLQMIAPDSGVWALSAIVVLIGLVVTLFSFTGKRGAKDQM